MQRTLRSFARAGVVLACCVVGWTETGLAQTQNDNGRPGFWEPPVDHGPHAVSPIAPWIGCNGDTTRFIPIHGCLIPVGPYRGCVLVWEKGGQALPAWPNGRLSMAGQVSQWAHADVLSQPEAWTNGSTLAIGAGNTLLDEPACVLFPPITPAYRDVEFMIGGFKTTAAHGGTSADVTNECHFLDTRAATPTWVGPVPQFAMHHARKFHNAVIAPDASVIVIGGGIAPDHGTPGYGQLEPEMFYNGAWIRLAAQGSERTYHSWALALDDGRILSGGGDHCLDIAEYEIFEPPYLEGSPARPAFVGTPTATIQYGQQYTFGFSAPFGQKVERVALLRPGSVTHGHDPNQRYEPLTIVPNPIPGEDAISITVLAPSNPTLIPPGYCMMFLVSSAGVPSVAHWVQLMP